MMMMMYDSTILSLLTTTPVKIVEKTPESKLTFLQPRLQFFVFQQFLSIVLQYFLPGDSRRVGRYCIRHTNGRHLVCLPLSVKVRL